MLKTTSDMNLFNCTLRSLERSSVTAVLLRRHSGAPAPAVAVLKYHDLTKKYASRYRIDIQAKNNIWSYDGIHNYLWRALLM
jgi:hypothetical protein